jgi:hypothetical protein
MKRIIGTLFFCYTVLNLIGCDASGLTGTDLPPAPVADGNTINGVRGAVSSADVISIADAFRVGSSKLGRDTQRVGMTLETSGLPDGHAVTIWWIVFNNPEACATTPCDEPDLFNPEVEADVLYAAGAVTQTGRGYFRGRLTENDRSGSIAHVFEMPAASGLHNAETAEVHLIVRSHGPVIPEVLERQLNSYEGGCNTELPVGEIPRAVGECADVEFAVHMAN